MVKSIEAKVRPVAANSGLEKPSLVGAARIYVSSVSLLTLLGTVENGKRCLVERLHLDGGSSPAADQAPVRREATLWTLPQKDLSPNVVNMTRAFLEATDLKVGDRVRISLLDGTPDADQVLAQDVSEDQGDETEQRLKDMPSWDAARCFSLSLSLDRADVVFPGMVFEGVSISRLKRNYKVLSVNGHVDNLAKFKLGTSDVRIVQPHDEGSPGSGAETFADELTIKGVPGLSSQIHSINQILSGFTGPFWTYNELNSCGFVIHGSRGTGKTFILRRIAEAKWGRPFWIRPTDKLTAIRDTFKQARTLQPSIVLMDNLDKLIAKDRSNREAVIDAIAEELDALSCQSSRDQALLKIIIVATCQDYMSDIPVELQKAGRFQEEVALPIPRASERLEILQFLDPPLHPDHKSECLESMAQNTHAFTPEDLDNLVSKAKRTHGRRLGKRTGARDGAAVFMSSSDMYQALKTVKPTAMHDVNLQPPTIHWQDVGGQEDIKKALKRMIRYTTKEPDPSAQAVCRNLPKGLLMYGPPGCSKTLLAQAMATESGFNFFAVKGAELLNMYVGESERAIRSLFARARAASPAIIFFDEIDSIGGQRGSSGRGGSGISTSAGSVHMLTTLLTEMDGFETLTGVFVLAATNRPEAIDPALMRPGRFSDVLYVGPPTQATREAIFGVHLKGLALADDVHVPTLAAETEGYSGAEIRGICEKAGQNVQDRYYDEYDDDDGDGGEGTAGARLEIAMDDLREAVRNTKPMITKDMIDGYARWAGRFERK